MSLKDLSHAQLKEKAISLGLKTGVHQMNKASLIEAIEKLEAAKDSGQLQPQPEEHKSVLDKIIDGVSSIVHPSQPENCPVTDEPCEKDCASDECKATVSQDVADKMIQSGEASIPSEAIIKSSSEESDLEKHPKFAKFKKQGDQLP